MFDFDLPIDRSNSDSHKWQRYRDTDIIPMWVADMDFASPPPVVEALQHRVAHGVFGYADPDPQLKECIAAHLKSRFDWSVSPQWIVWLPGLVTGLNVACRSVGRPGAGVLSMVPIYPPFLSAPRLAGKHLQTIRMEIRNGLWHFDSTELQRALNERSALLMLCNPHNPTGRVFSRGELEELAQICLRAGLTVCSDEIHCDLVLETGCRHLPFASISPAVAERTITLMAPSKTFNLPGLGCAFAVISNADLRARFKRVMAGIVPHVNALGFTAALAAYRSGGAWLEALLSYLRDNRDLLLSSMPRLAPLQACPVQATYLAWIDARPAGLSEAVHFFEEAGVGLSEGADFGAPGFVRLNFGCRRALLSEAIDRMAGALERLRALRA